MASIHIASSEAFGTFLSLLVISYYASFILAAASEDPGLIFSMGNVQARKLILHLVRSSLYGLRPPNETLKA